jgi:hypothetical protein
MTTLAKKTRFTAAIGFGLALLVAEPVRATEATDQVALPTALELSEEARARYDEGNFARALSLFNQAYANEADPNLLFNVARCHERLGQTNEALDKYEAFLASRDGDPTGRERAEAARRDLRAKREAASGATAAPSGSRHTFDSAEATSEPPLASSSSLTPWLLLGAGVAAVASGAVVHSLGVGDHHDVEEQPGYGDPSRVAPMTQREAKDHVESGKHKKLVGGLLLGGGGALIASSALLFLFADRAEAPSRVGVGLSPGGASIAVNGRF